MTTPQVLAPLPNAAPRPKILQPGDGERIELFGDSVHFLLTGAETGGRVLLMHSEDSPGAGPLLCVRQSEDVLFLVESGCYEFALGNERLEAGPGTMIFVPRGVPYTYRVVSDEASRLITACLPAGFENFQRQFAHECATGAPHSGHISELAAQFGVWFLAPEAVAEHCTRCGRAAVVKLPEPEKFSGHSERLMLSDEDTCGVLNIVEWQMPAGSCPVLSTQRREDAIFLVREGCWEFEIGDAWVQVGPDSTVLVPSPHPHSCRVIGAQTGNLLLLSYSAGG